VRLPWYVRRFIGVVLGIVIALTFGSLWGGPFVRTLAWMAGMTADDVAIGLSWFTLPGMVLGGLLCSLPAAAVAAAWILGDSAGRTGRGTDERHPRPVDGALVRRMESYQHNGWLIVLGMLVGLMMSAPYLLDDWSMGLRHMVRDVAPDLELHADVVVAAIIQSFPFAAAALFVWSTVGLFLPQRWHRWPGSDRWVPWRAMAIGAGLWLAAVLVAVLPTYLQLA
jgi:hypothetical protein